MKRLNASQKIMIVDDSDDDYSATVRALSRDGGLQNPLHRCEDGQQALDYLFRRGFCNDEDKADLPGIILLDLNMPRIDGRRVLEELKKDDRLKRIPVIVMTNSNADRDIDECYRLGANTYINKPFEWAEFCKVIRHLKEYWFEIASIPKW